MEIEKTIGLEQAIDQGEDSEQKNTPIAKELTHTMEEIEELIGEKYLAIDGEQKVYILPDNATVEQVLSNFKGLQTGEIKQSQIWRKTDIKLDNQEQRDIIAAMDKRIKRLELLLNQKAGHDTPQ